MDAVFVLWVCVKGKGGIVIDDRLYELNSREMLITFPGDPHVRCPLKGQSGEWVLVPFECDNGHLLECLRKQIIRMDQVKLELFHEFLSVFKQARSDGDFYMPTAMLRLELLLESLRESSISGQLEYPEQSPSWMKQTFDHLSSAERFDKIAAKMSLSPGYLRRKFKAAVGRTPMQLRQVIRLIKAQNLLLNSNYNISQIAAQTGFESIYSFSRFFKQHFGVSPMQYRKNPDIP